MANHDDTARDTERFEAMRDALRRAVGEPKRPTGSSSQTPSRKRPRRFQRDKSRPVVGEGPPEIVEAAHQEREYPGDETNEG